MRFHSSSFDYLVETVLILILLSDAVQAGRPRGTSTSRHAPPRRPATLAVFDGVAQTQLIVAQEKRPPSTHNPSPVSGNNNVEDRCLKISCMTEGDCAQNNCGGYFCFHCETCSTGPVMGTCVWDRAKHQRNCPKKICNGPARSHVSSQSSSEQTSGDGQRGNKADGNTPSTATATATATSGQASGKPWVGLFQNLRLDNSKNGTVDKGTEKDKREGTS